MSQVVYRQHVSRHSRYRLIGRALLLTFFLVAGCHRHTLRGTNSPPSSFAPAFREALSPTLTNRHDESIRPLGFIELTAPTGDTQQSLSYWEDQLALAASFDARQNAQCVDLYYEAATQTSSAAMALWQPQNETSRGWSSLYQRSLTGLLDASQRYGRFSPTGGIVVRSAGRDQIIPASYYGFAWKPHDFSQLTPAHQYRSSELSRHYVCDGIGVSQVAQRAGTGTNEWMRAENQTFSVTVVLRPPTDARLSPVLEFYNPLVFDSLCWNDTSLPLARDLTAAAAAMLEETPRRYLQGFTAPTDISVRPKLVSLEPYQPGKIPLLFVHGLYSDPITWVNMINEIQAQSDLYAQYQIWLYRYPTGGGLLDSVTSLRQQLSVARDQLDPMHQDPAFDQMVLVGHSLGGIVSKLQVTSSEDILWRQVATRPFDTLRATPEMRNRLAGDFFFEPLPFIRRVVFIATPHRGSAMAQRLIGRIGSRLVRYGTEANWEYETLLDDNPGLFRPEMAVARPTSVDLLEPSSPLLQGIAALRISPRVQLHSIIGTGGCATLKPAGDGTVSVASARHAGVVSEQFVNARHEQIHKHLDTVREMHRILRQHALAH